jgi:antitoxin HigA-1
MLPTNRIPSHPGEILLEEFLQPLGITQTQLASVLHVSVQRINELANGKRGIPADTAWLLASALGTRPEFSMNLQTQYDLATSKPAHLPKAVRR